MPDSGSGLFTDIEEYRIALPIRSELLVLRPSKFRALLTVGKLPQIRLLRACETTSRVGYFCLSRADVVVSFPTFRNSSLVYNGLELRWGQIVFHRSGECFHQRIGDSSGWGIISTSSASLSKLSGILLGRMLSGPDVSKIVTPRSSDYTSLLRVHAQAGRIAEKNLSRITHPEVARALDQELLFALITCLGAGPSRRLPPGHRREAEVVIGLENAIAGNPDRMLTQAELAAAGHVSERVLKACSARVLGMDPCTYQGRKWLRNIDLALLHAKVSGAVLDGVVRRYGLSGIAQFADEYRSVYGEPPGISHAQEHESPLQDDPGRAGWL